MISPYDLCVQYMYQAVGSFASGLRVFAPVCASQHLHPMLWTQFFPPFTVQTTFIWYTESALYRCSPRAIVAEAFSSRRSRCSIASVLVEVGEV